MKPLAASQIRRYLALALRAARKGGARAHRYFRHRVPVTLKVDDSPVTRADREAEQVIRRVLQKACPDHQLCGEEYGWDPDWDAEFRWWIDPVDGTRQFVRGLPHWGTLLALEHRGKIVVGVLHHPALKLTVWAAQGFGCFANGKRVRVSGVSSPRNGTLLYGAWRLFSKSQRPGLLRLVEEAHDERGFGDSYAHALVAMGMAEAMVDPVVQPYDVAAVKICVEEAGGRFTDLTGRATHRGIGALSSNGRAHGRILRTLGARPRHRGNSR